MGFDHHKREAATSPGKVFGSLLGGRGGSGGGGGKGRLGKPDGRPSTATTTTTTTTTTATTATTVPLPTNAWYQNLLLGSVNDHHLTPANRAYTIPYLLDFVGPIPGVRVQIPRVLGSDTIVQLSAVESHGLTLGTMGGGLTDDVYSVDEDSPPRQTVAEASGLMSGR